MGFTIFVEFVKADMMEKKPNSDVLFSDTFNNDILRRIIGDEFPDNLPEDIDNETLTEFFEIDQLETDLNLPNGFFVKLRDEDDWSFVIKLHALIEAAITHLLVKQFNQVALKEVFSFLELSNFRTGKIAFASSINLIDTDTKRFIQKLSEMRNAFIHDITNVNIEIKSFLDDLDKGTQKGYRKGFLLGHQAGKKIQIKYSKDLYSTKALTQLFGDVIFDYLPKLSIWFGAMVCLGSIYNNIALAEIRAQKQALDEQILGFLEMLIPPSQDLIDKKEVEAKDD